MVVAIVVLAINIALLVVFAPLKFEAKSHFSLAREQFVADVFVFKIKVAHINLQIENGSVQLKINGKRLKRKSNKSNGRQLLATLKNEKIKIATNVIALVGTQNAMLSAIVCALLGNFANCYLAISSQKCEIEAKILTKLNVLQIAQLFLSSLVNGNA